MAEREDPPRDDEMPGWIDRVTSVAGALGFNRVRVRWKLVRWVNQRRGAANRRAQSIDHLKYENRVCPKCTAVNARDEQVCTRCGTALHSRPRELLGRLGLRGPVITSMSTVIALAILAVYARTAIAGHGGLDIPIAVLIRHGGNLPEDMPGFEPWRYLTSVLLHAGIIHLAFNLLSLAVVGPQVEEDYGRWPTLFLFLATGVFAAFVSRHTGLAGVGIGASGAIMGLIGIVAAAGHRAGTTRGRIRRNDMLKWALYTIFFGFLVRADNRAHLAGFVLGAAIGLLVSPRVAARRPVRIIGNLLGGLAMVALLGGVALTMVPPARIAPQYAGEQLLFDPSSGDPGDLDDVGTAIAVCSSFRRGNLADAETAAQVCESLESLRVACVHPDRADAWLPTACKELRRLGGLLVPAPR